MNDNNSNNNWQKWIGKVVCRNYKIEEKLDAGSFGTVFRASRTVMSNNQFYQKYYAVKIEEYTKSQKNWDTLTKEAKILYEMNAEKGFPRLFYYIKNMNINTMAITLLDTSLFKLHQKCQNRFSLKTVLMLLDQMIVRLQYFHSKGYIHRYFQYESYYIIRDIKPDNFMIGTDQDKSTIYMIDFGLAKRYKEKDGSHIQYKENVGLVGTTRYTSTQSHMGIYFKIFEQKASVYLDYCNFYIGNEQSRRDDLESLGYTVIYLLKGTLPWMNLQAKDKAEKNRLIAKIKISTKMDELCDQLPKEFASYMKYVKNLGFYEEPNYQYFKKLFRTLFLKMNYDYDDMYDWIQDKQNENHKHLKHELSKIDDLKQDQQKMDDNFRRMDSIQKEKSQQNSKQSTENALSSKKSKRNQFLKYETYNIPQKNSSEEDEPEDKADKKSLKRKQSIKKCDEQASEEEEEDLRRSYNRKHSRKFSLEKQKTNELAIKEFGIQPETIVKIEKSQDQSKNTSQNAVLYNDVESVSEVSNFRFNQSMNNLSIIAQTRVCNTLSELQAKSEQNQTGNTFGDEDKILIKQETKQSNHFDQDMEEYPDSTVSEMMWELNNAKQFAPYRFKDQNKEIINDVDSSVDHGENKQYLQYLSAKSKKKQQFSKLSSSFQ